MKLYIMNYTSLKRTLAGTIKQVLSDKLQAMLDEIRFTGTPSGDMGDLSFPCFDVAKTIKKNPSEVARELANAIKPNDIIKETRSVGPYLNFFIKDDVLFESIVDAAREAGMRAGNSDIGKGETIMLEYLSPNTNKPLHIGHLRNACIGDSMARILESQGWNVARVQIINDRGAHICKSMLMYQKYGKGKTPDNPPLTPPFVRWGEDGALTPSLQMGSEKVSLTPSLRRRGKGEVVSAITNVELSKIKPDHFVGKFYEMFEREAVENPELQEEAQEMLRKWEKGDTETRVLWEKLNSWVYEGWKETVAKLAVDNKKDRLYYESEIYEKGKEVVQKGLRDGIFYTRDDGAVEIDLTLEGLDKKVLLRADGTSIYITQDLYLAFARAQEFPKASGCIYVVGKDQEYHFKVLFILLQKLGLQKKYHHLSYGMLRLKEGKMSSRKGTVVNADDLIGMIDELALREVEKRSDKSVLLESHLVGEEIQQKGSKEYSEMSSIEQLQEFGRIPGRYPYEQQVDQGQRAHAIALAALKYYIFHVDPSKDIVFDAEQAVRFEGATGPYIQYSYARIRSIIAKSQNSNLKIQNHNSKLKTFVFNIEEREIVNKLAQFQPILEKSAREYSPAHLSHYLFELAEIINSFYHKHDVLKAEPHIREKRLRLLDACGVILNKGLSLLGIEAVERM